jgi:hypothetical protein
MTTDFFRRLFACLLAPLALVLASCGGGGGAGGAGPAPEPETPAQVRLVAVGSPVLPTEGGELSLPLEAFVVDSRGVTMPGRIVAFTVTDLSGGVVAQPQNNGITDESGKATATLTLAGSAQERTVTVQASVGERSSEPLQVRIVGATVAAQVYLLSRNGLTLPSDGATPLELDAYVVDANNNAMANVPVSFVAVDGVSPPGIVVQPLSGGRTDATGRAAAILRLGADPQNRAFTVRASANAMVSAPLNLAVTGTSISVSGPTTITLAGTEPTEFPIQLKDSSGAGIADRILTVASQAGNQVLTPTVRTDADGVAVAQVRGTRAGADTIVVSGLGATASASIQISDQTVAFSTGSRTTAAVGSTGASLVVRYSRVGGIPSGTQVSFATTRGVVSPVSADISSGSATVRVTSAQAGPATITATVNGVTASHPLNFFATAPASITLQASPQIVTANVIGSTENRSSLIAVIRDAAGNPVANRRVAFTAEQDASGGSITPPVVTTDSSGQAISNFVAGANTTPTNAVQIVARDLDASSVVSLPARVTVAGRQLFVRVETDNRVEKVNNPPIYRKNFAVVVTDSAGNGIPEAAIQAKVVPVRYALGFWEFTDVWTQNIEDVLASEDQNFDGFCSPGEDTNGDGYLTPGNVAAVSGGSATDEAGIAELVLSYPQAFGAWVEVVLEVSAVSTGTESQTAARFWLPVSAEDVSSPSGPPGIISPFPYPPNDPGVVPPLNPSCP